MCVCVCGGGYIIPSNMFYSNRHKRYLNYQRFLRSDFRVSFVNVWLYVGEMI